MNIRLKEEIISVESNVCDVHCPARVQNEFIENFMKFFVWSSLMTSAPHFRSIYEILILLKLKTKFENENFLIKIGTHLTIFGENFIQFERFVEFL